MLGIVVDPAVHAALIVVFAWLINLLFAYLHLNLGGDIANQLAAIIVAYILSLGGFAVYARLIYGKLTSLTSTPHYHPPFS